MPMDLPRNFLFLFHEQFQALISVCVWVCVDVFMCMCVHLGVLCICQGVGVCDVWSVWVSMRVCVCAHGCGYISLRGMGLFNLCTVYIAHTRYMCTYQGFPAGRVYLDYMSMQRYTILVGNPWYIMYNVWLWKKLCTVFALSSAACGAQRQHDTRCFETKVLSGF